jgi:hypothetical protein
MQVRFLPRTPKLILQNLIQPGFPLWGPGLFFKNKSGQHPVFCYNWPMDEESHNILEETLELEKENNRLLKKIWQTQKWRLIFVITKWVIIIAIAGGAYYFIQPYVKLLLDNLNEIKEVIDFMPR